MCPEPPNAGITDRGRSGDAAIVMARSSPAAPPHHKIAARSLSLWDEQRARRMAG